ncbi:MAG: shikimate kinase [PS1 clade bacterium]|uniref:Shikimate kinase n=1 Tax=PS1 clade bacterium TaxID=2175152 RepID=A0A937L6R9_9PROT|nr:shikimate kinase [PS1 clade bacterium]
MTKLQNRDAIKAQPIVLIGMMGAGKSSLGVRLAEALETTFLDADAEVEKAAAMSIAEIFEKHGEAAFRDGERRVIKRLLDDGPMVLALGGGAFMDDQTRALVQQKALSVWLDVPLAELVKRVKKKPDKRPLLKGQNIEAKLTELMQTRGPVYATAALRVDVGGGTHEQAVARLLVALDAHYAA